MINRALCPVMVGREAELSDLDDALLAALRGEGAVALLSGEAGMGKTRLTAALNERARRLGAVVMTGGCSEAELALPFLPFIEAIGNQLAATEIETMTAALGASAAELAQLFPQMGHSGSNRDGGDPAQAKLRLFEAIIALVRLVAQEHGLLLIVEDIHWADSSTRDLLDYMTRRLRGSKVLVLATYRADELHRRHQLQPLLQGWRRSSQVAFVELAPLSPEGVGAMVKAIFESRRASLSS
ncbi:MAG: BREX system ATP-binding domain-containing protein [Candidatus Dormibacteria bacterium]